MGEAYDEEMINLRHKLPMKILRNLLIPVLLINGSIHGQNAALYQAAISSLAPVRHYTIDGSLGDTVTGLSENTLYEWGTASTSSFSTVAYTSDFWGNANAAIRQLGTEGVTAVSFGRLGIQPGAMGLDMTASGQNTISFLYKMTYSDDPVAPATSVRNIFAQANNDGTRMGLREDDKGAAATTGLQLTAGGTGYTQWDAFHQRPSDGQWMFYAISWDNASEQIHFYLGDLGTNTLSKVSRSMDDDGTPGTDFFGFNDGDALNSSDEIKWLSSFSDQSDDAVMDELAVWNTVLSDGQIQSQFNAIPEPSTVAVILGLLGLAGSLMRTRKR